MWVLTMRATANENGQHTKCPKAAVLLHECIILKCYVQDVEYFFVMEAMPFPCNAILLIQGNLPRIFPM